MSTNNKFFLKITTALICIFLALIFIGDQTVPKVVSATHDKTQIKLTFNRLVNIKKAQDSFVITPKVEGEFSWIGRKMAFTGKFEPGTKYNVSLQNITDMNQKTNPKKFDYSFTTPAHQLLFLRDRSLYRYDFLLKKEFILTPKNLKILEYKTAANFTYFFAVDNKKIAQENYLSDAQELYRLNLTNGKVTKIAESGRYVNFTFSVSADGQQVALMRAELNNKILENREVVIINSSGSETFWFDRMMEYPIIFSPFGDSLLGPAYDVGYVIAPLEFNPNKVQELGTYSYSYGFSPNGQNAIFSIIDKNENSSFIQLNSDGQKQSYSPTWQPDSVQIFDGEIFFTGENSKGYALINYNFDTQKESTIRTETEKSLEQFSISSDQKMIAIETFPLTNEIGLGSKARAYKENIENSFTNTEIIITDKSGLPKAKILGRSPQFIN